MKTFISVAAVYLFCSFMTFDALNAYDQADCHKNYQLTCDARMVRHEVGMNIAVSMLPPAWFAAILITGFYADGFSWTWSPAR